MTLEDSVATLKKDIKLWERSFRASNGRDPTINDIKQLPFIADKYKRYKELSKQMASRSMPSTSTPSPSSDSLPNHSKSHTSVVSRARDVKYTAPLSSYNPFSPKKKGSTPKYDTTNVANRPSPKRTHVMVRSPLPNSFPAAKHPQPTVPQFPPVTPVKDNAMSRAKKRLRGEPVSPTPNKDKKRRVDPGVGLSRLPFSLNSPESDEHDMEEDPAPRAAFIDDSPVKKSEQNKNFQRLFTEKLSSVPLLETPNPDDGNAGGVMEMSLEDPLHSDDSIVGSSFSELGPLHSQPKKNLIPPSPPNVSRQRSGNAGEVLKSKSKSKLIAKESLDQDENSDTGEDAKGGHIKVKLLDSKCSRYPRRLNTVSDDEDLSDPKSEVPLGHDRPHGFHEGVSSMQVHQTEIDLPNALRHVLVLQPDDSKTRIRQEEQIVKSLVSGSRVLHYDPRRGGEIWGVGEDDKEVSEFIDDTNVRDVDDWEDEPVPWEVGEL